MIFNPRKGGGRFFDILPPPSPLKKSGFQVWGGGGGRTKSSLGDAFLLDKIIILEGGQTNHSPLEVRYANRPNKRGMWRHPLHAGLAGFDLTTSAR